eukprot:g15654.t1
MKCPDARKSGLPQVQRQQRKQRKLKTTMFANFGEREQLQSMRRGNQRNRSQPEHQKVAQLSRFDAAATYEKQVQEEFSRLRQQREEEQLAKQPQLTLEQQQQLALLKEHQQQQPQIHPDAQLDWGGSIIPANSRKQYRNHVSQQQAVSAENGWMMPSERADMQRKANRKKKFENDINFAGLESEVKGMPLHTATYQQAPGIVGHNTSHWKTNYEAQVDGDKLGYGRKKNNSVRRVKPAYERNIKGRRPGVHFDFGPMEDVSNSQNNSKHVNFKLPEKQECNLAYAGGKGLKNGHNMLKGLGASIASKLINEGSIPKSKPLMSTEAYDRKINYLDNYNKTSLPGYTGHRRRY